MQGPNKKGFSIFRKDMTRERIMKNDLIHYNKNVQLLIKKKKFLSIILVNTNLSMQKYKTKTNNILKGYKI